MALLKYSELLSYGKDKVREVMAPLRANEMRKKGELELAKLDNQIAEYDQMVQECASSYPIDFYKLLEAIDRVAVAERQQKKLAEVIEQLFPKDEQPTPPKAA